MKLRLSEYKLTLKKLDEKLMRVERKRSHFIKLVQRHVAAEDGIEFERDALQAHQSQSEGKVRRMEESFEAIRTEVERVNSTLSHRSDDLRTCFDNGLDSMWEVFARESANWLEHTQMHFRRGMGIAFWRERDAVAKRVLSLDRFVEEAAKLHRTLRAVVPSDKVDVDCQRVPPRGPHEVPIGSMGPSVLRKKEVRGRLVVRILKMPMREEDMMVVSDDEVEAGPSRDKAGSPTNQVRSTENKAGSAENEIGSGIAGPFTR